LGGGGDGIVWTGGRYSFPRSYLGRPFSMLK
jgi:hypothetical protein